MRSDFICPECDNRWSMTPDKDGLFNGYGNPPCPSCGTNGADPNDFGDWKCGLCDHTWRSYGNGGLMGGGVPFCPKCRADGDVVYSV